MRPAGIALSYSIKNIRSVVCQIIIGASVSKTYTSELIAIFHDIIIYTSVDAKHHGGSLSKNSICTH